jgi:hypothetical protein
VSSIEILDECLVADICIDRYLWALYQRTPKEDTIKVDERSKVTVRKKGKTVTVTKSFIKLVDEDFAWKATCTGGVSGGSICDESVNAASTIDAGSAGGPSMGLQAEAAARSPGPSRTSSHRRCRARGRTARNRSGP